VVWRSCLGPRSRAFPAEADPAKASHGSSSTRLLLPASPASRIPCTTPCCYLL